MPQSERTPEGSLVRNQLERIVASEAFSRSARLSALLRYLVEETLGGRGDSLKEQVLSAALYDGREGSMVRTDARRLRDKLREYYSDVPDEPLIITLPKGCYTPSFVLRSDAPAPARAGRRRKWAWLGAAVAAAGLIAWRLAPPRSAPLRIVPLTQYAGGESDPAFSPDGNFIAFAWWKPPGPAPQDIWIKAVDGEALRQVTNTPAPVAEHSPAWSPNGKEIAFERVGWGGERIDNAGVYVISVLGGTERRISERGRNPRWSPDGKSIWVTEREGIVAIDLAGMQRRQVTSAPDDQSDGKFEFSPDGSRIAFLRSRRAGVSDVYVASVAGGEARQLTAGAVWMQGVAWTADGREVIYDVAGESLWRIPADARTPGRGRPVAGVESLVTAAARAVKPVIRGTRLVFQVQNASVNLRLVNLDGNSPVLVAQPLIDSTRVDRPGQFSLNGEMLSFYSLLTGAGAELWVARRDGTATTRVRTFASQTVRPGSWSPDAKELAVDALVHGNTDVYVVGP